MTTPLDHLRVIDLTHHVAGPYCTKLLAGFGADVVKIERPATGDPLRAVGPFARGEQGLETGLSFLWLNTGKRSVALNLKAPEGAAILKRLVRDADLVVENFAPRVLPALGLDFQNLRASNPGLVLVSISNFGQTGPYRDCRAEEITAYAMSGMMSMTGSPAREPLAPGPALTQYSAGLWAFFCAQVALYRRTDAGEHVDVSIQESGIDNVEIAMVNQLHQGVRAKRARHMMVPWELYPCRDGYATVIGGPFRRWTNGCALFGEPRLFEEKYRHIRGRHEHRAEVDALIQPWLDGHTREEVFRAGQEHGMAFGYLASFDEVMKSPQHRARGFFTEVEHPVAGTHEYCDAPYKMSRTPWTQRRAPLLGEHTDLILGELGIGADELARLRRTGVIG